MKYKSMPQVERAYFPLIYQEKYSKEIAARKRKHQQEIIDSMRKP